MGPKRYAKETPITFKSTSRSYDLTLKKQKQLNAINKQLLMIVLELGR